MFQVADGCMKKTVFFSLSLAVHNADGFSPFSNTISNIITSAGAIFRMPLVPKDRKKVKWGFTL